MGRALASAFLTAGHPLTLWNRTPGKAGELRGRGAVEAAAVPDAVRAGQVVVACLVDHDAVRATLDRSPADWEDRLLVNLTSGEPSQAREMADWAAARGIRYLDGAILTPTPTIGTPAATVLLSGSPGAFAAAEPALAATGGTLLHLGDDPGRAAAYDVALLDLFATCVNGLVHAFALATAEGIPPERFAAFATGIGGLLPEMTTRFAHQIATGHFPGDRSTIGSAASGITHVINAAASHGIDTSLLTAARATLTRAVAAGHASEGLARLATLF
jgi:3-hydroxyisobutyrate dehydrogenase-like beta-hydroxyacid dehydrogenase